MAQRSIPVYEMTGPQRAAVILLALGADYGKPIWESLDDDEIRIVTHAMVQLGNIEADAVEELILEFVGNLSAAGAVSGSFDRTAQLLSQLLPAHSRIAVLGRTVNPLARLELRDLEAAARALGLEIVFFDTTTPEDMGAAFAQAARQRVAAVLTLADPIFVSRRAQLAELEQRHRIPGIHPANEIVRAGGCMSYSVNGVEMFRRGARYVALILRGSAPGDLPVEQLTHFELWINLGRAKAIGLDVPPALLLRADRVIE